MKEFFKRQLETLHARTGIRQLEHLMAENDWQGKVRELINLMVEECEKPPFDKVDEVVKMRVIDRAVIEDDKFIGLNAKFVRKALGAWWLANGDRVLEKLNRAEANASERVVLTPEQSAKVDAMLEQYKRQLLVEPGFRPVPKLEHSEVKKEGAEWKSELERKAYSTGYKPMDPEEYEMQNRIRRAGAAFYKTNPVLSGMRHFPVGGYLILAQSPEDAKAIYESAIQDGF